MVQKGAKLQPEGAVEQLIGAEIETNGTKTSSETYNIFNELLDIINREWILSQYEANKALLELLLKIKELDFKYIGLDLEDEDRKVTYEDSQASKELAQKWDKRNEHVVQTIMKSAQLCNGGLITLNGAAHLIAIAQLLEESYQTDTMLASNRKELTQYSFLRIFDRAVIQKEEVVIQQAIENMKHRHTWLTVTQLELTDTGATDIYLNGLGEQIPFYDPAPISDQHTVQLLNKKCHTFFSAMKWRDNELVDAVTKHPDVIKKPDVQRHLRQAGVFFYLNNGTLTIPGVNTTTVCDAIKDMQPK